VQELNSSLEPVISIFPAPGEATGLSVTLPQTSPPSDTSI